MTEPVITDKDRVMAEKCVQCPVCHRARDEQRGFAYWFVKKIKGDICPF